MRNMLIVLFLMSIIVSCKETNNNEEIIKDPYFKKYVFLGHIYQWHTSGNRVDKRIEQLNFSLYDQIWLGGDVCSEATLEHATINYIDNLFDLSSENTHWTLGNHDVRNGHLDWITTATTKNLFYAQYIDGFTLFNLNTSLHRADTLELVNPQIELFTTVCDTISQSTHLIVVMHNVVWQNISDDFDVIDFANADYNNWIARFNPNETFEQTIYPLLVELENKGVDVICISGDVGQREQKTFEFETDEGVVFLGSGINNSYEPDPIKASQLPRDQILILEHDLKTEKITWAFHVLNEM